MRIFVTGSSGQVALSLEEASQGFDPTPLTPDLTLQTLGRPGLDLGNPAQVEAAITAFNPDIIINAAAYTAVDNAETEKDAAFSINAEGPAVLAGVAADLDIPLLHISTDYVFDGSKEGPYVETDPTGPTGVYGESKLRGEELALQRHNKVSIFRTAWVYSPFGKNFLKTMLSLSDKPSLSVVSDQVGNPTYAPDIANALLSIAYDILATGWQPEYRGVFHLAGSGETSWHGFAEAIFDEGAKVGLSRPQVAAISTEEYPTPAKRPANSRLNCNKLADTFGQSLPDWRDSTAECVKRLSQMGELG